MSFPYHEVVERVAGPLVWEEPQKRARGQLNGRPVWFHINRWRGGVGLHVVVPVARPMHYGVYRRKRTSSDRPEVRTGDAAFDDMYLTVGGPPELVREVLDPAMRGWIRALYPDMDPDLSSWNGEDARLWHNLRDELTAERLTALATFVQLFAARVIECFDRAQQAIAAQQGPGAAATWIAERHHELAQLPRLKRVFAIKLIVVLLLVTAGIAALIFALR